MLTGQWMRMRRIEIDLGAEITAHPPAKIKLELAASVGNERQWKYPIPAYRKIPSAVRI
jgi:hypothetical protein